MARIVITLKDKERNALIKLAERELRDPRDQAALLIRDGLQRAALLPADTTPIATSPQQPTAVQ